MITANLIQYLNKDEFEVIYASSAPYLATGNYGRDCYQDDEGEWWCNNLLRLKDAVLHEFITSVSNHNEHVCSFELREEETGHLLSLKIGTLYDGTFKTGVTLMNPNSDGSLSWIYHPPSDTEIEELMIPTGIKRILMTPIGANFIAMCENTSVRVTDADNGNRQYRSTWGWDNYETDLVDM